jgi:hypothetical protein
LTAVTIITRTCLAPPNDDDLRARTRVAEMMRLESVLLASLGREAEAAAVIDALLLRFGDASEPELRSVIVEVRSWKMAESREPGDDTGSAGRLCPPSDATPRRLLHSKTATDVLVPGHPTSALICRYWGRSSGIPEPEDERARIREGEHGHPVYTIAGARRVVRKDVTSYLASELDALPPIGPHPNCDEVLGGRSELISFYYRGGGEARVIFHLEGCVAVRNGRIASYGLGMGHGNGESHWADEALL